MLIVSLIFSMVFFLVTVTAVWRSRDLTRTYPKVWIGVPCGYLFLCILTTYMLHALLTSVAATVCLLTGAGRRTFACAAVGSFVVSYGIVGVPLAADLWRASREYPLESIQGRLAYEHQAPRPKAAARAGSPPADADEFDDWSLDRYPARRREMSLQDLHTGCVKMFVNAPGFGVARMFGPSTNDIRRGDKLRDAPPLALPEPSQPGEAPVLSAGDLNFWPDGDPARPAAGVLWGDLRAVHRASAGQFLSPLGFGYVRDLGHVAGFVSHRFAECPPRPKSPTAGGHWRLESLDLISLLKYPEPVVYVSRHLPRMDDLRDAPTRPLDDFEATGLAKLRSGDELATVQGPHRIRMLGGLRAREECLRCHTGEAGDLVGAFSYDLRRDLPVDGTPAAR